jgi:hypothetical protein
MVIARRRRRWGLYVPYILLLVLALAWSAFWFIGRDRAAAALDRAIAREAERGRIWTCPNRAIAGFPFRFEVTCELPTFAGNTVRGPVEGRVTRLLALAQIYDPNLVIVRLEGPLALRAVNTNETARLEWSSFDVSIRDPLRDTRQPSLSVKTPVLRLDEGDGETVAASGDLLTVHVRMNPQRQDEQAYDMVGRLERASIPALDRLLGDTAPANIELQATVTQGEAFGRGSRSEQLERWRAQDGLVDLVLLSLVKGKQRLEAKGRLAIDPTHRPVGLINASAAGLDEVIRRETARMGGRRETFGGLVAESLDVLAKRRQADDGKPGLLPLPPLRIGNGKVSLGPLPLPIVLDPLY